MDNLALRLAPPVVAALYIDRAVHYPGFVVEELHRHGLPMGSRGFGGTRAFYGLLDMRPDGLRASGCFPAGHASAGYAWLALYFFAREVQPKLRYWALGAGVCLGLVFGIAQQIRGAHFVSDDLWTAAVCWLVGVGLFVFWPPSTCVHTARDWGCDGAAPVD